MRYICDCCGKAIKNPIVESTRERPYCLQQIIIYIAVVTIVTLLGLWIFSGLLNTLTC